MRAWLLAPYPHGFLKEAAGMLRVEGCLWSWLGNFAGMQSSHLQDHRKEKALSVHLLGHVLSRRRPAPEKPASVVLFLSQQ